MDTEHQSTKDLDQDVYQTTVDLQSVIHQVSTMGELCTTPTQDLLLSIDDGRDNRGFDDARHSRQLVGLLVVKQLEQQNWIRSNEVCLPLIQDLCIPRIGYTTFTSSLVWTYGHHDYNHSCHHSPYGDSSHLTSACHHLPSLHHSCILLFYDYAITILTILMTHTFSYLSRTLSGLSLDPHSFDYSFLSHLCSLLLSSPHSLCNHSICTHNAISSELLFSHGHSSIYSVVAIHCSSLALISQGILHPSRSKKRYGLVGLFLLRKLVTNGFLSSTLFKPRHTSLELRKVQVRTELSLTQHHPSLFSGLGTTPEYCLQPQVYKRWVVFCLQTIYFLHPALLRAQGESGPDTDQVLCHFRR